MLPVPPPLLYRVMAVPTSATSSAMAVVAVEGATVCGTEIIQSPARHGVVTASASATLFSSERLIICKPLECGIRLRNERSGRCGGTVAATLMRLRLMRAGRLRKVL
jgi:hypothetical protein